MIEAVLGPWQKVRLQQLARKAIHRLSRIGASGVFGGYSYDSVWGEYSHHIQNGEFSGFSDLLEDMAADACAAVAEAVPEHEMHLFDQLALALGEVDGMSGYEYLVQELKDLVSTKASIRDLDRYSDDYRWYENL
jgi:hypothetical protein